MSVVVIGVNNRTMPLDQFERLTVPGDRLPKALADLLGRRHVSEAVVLSTYNRTEVYVYAEKFHGAYQDVRDFLGEAAQLAPEDFADHVYASYDDEAVRHLFSVVAGLDSAVLGEAEIQGQVKTAWETARVEGSAATTLNAVFRHALESLRRKAGTWHGLSKPLRRRLQDDRAQFNKDVEAMFAGAEVDGVTRASMADAWFLWLAEDLGVAEADRARAGAARKAFWAAADEGDRDEAAGRADDRRIYCRLLVGCARRDCRAGHWPADLGPAARARQPRGAQGSADRARVE